MALDHQTNTACLEEEFENDRVAELIYAHYDEWGTMTITPRRPGPTAEELAQL